MNSGRKTPPRRTAPARVIPRLAVPEAPIKPPKKWKPPQLKIWRPKAPKVYYQGSRRA